MDQFSQFKIVFLPKNTTSRLQPLDAGIIQNFKVNYRKRLVKYVLARIQEDAWKTQIVKGVDVLVAIRWIQEVWKEVSNSTIKNCFEKCGIKGEDELICFEKCGIKGDDEPMEVEKDDDLEFVYLVKATTYIL